MHPLRLKEVVNEVCLDGNGVSRKEQRFLSIINNNNMHNIYL